jgi:hypothetical protein
MTVENATFTPYPQPGLRVEATWPTRPDGKPESLVVEVNDQPVTPELVNQVITALSNACGEVEPALITAALVDKQPVMEGGTAR